MENTVADGDRLMLKQTHRSDKRRKTYHCNSHEDIIAAETAKNACSRVYSKRIDEDSNRAQDDLQSN
jgi:hypothetical protein